MVQTVSARFATAAAQVSLCSVPAHPAPAASALHMWPGWAGPSISSRPGIRDSTLGDAIVDRHVRGKSEVPMQQHAPLHWNASTAAQADRRIGQQLGDMGDVELRAHCPAP